LLDKKVLEDYIFTAMPINKSLEADGRRNSFEPPTRGSRLYFTRVGGRPSSSDILGGGGRVEDPGTKLKGGLSGEASQPTVRPADQSTARQDAILIEGTGWDPKIKPSHARLGSIGKS
jgi:hypothetical protein